mmetsp:Transcript_5429/g.9141  ORF Transcript_5429/g.9141 Transcript_5429/m.9141 type:complete len:134 (-) Transcript_5429:508-909(-)
MKDEQGNDKDNKVNIDEKEQGELARQIFFQFQENMKDGLTVDQMIDQFRRESEGNGEASDMNSTNFRFPSGAGPLNTPSSLKPKGLGPRHMNTNSGLQNASEKPGESKNSKAGKNKVHPGVLPNVQSQQEIHK